MILTPSTAFVLELAGVGREDDGVKANARQPGAVESLRELFSVDPRGPDDLERRIGASADGEIGRLQESDARVQDRFGEAPDVGRGIDPAQAGGVEQVSPAPALDPDHLKIELEPAVVLEHLGDLADGHAVDDRQPSETR